MVTLHSQQFLGEIAHGVQQGVVLVITWLSPLGYSPLVKACSAYLKLFKRQFLNCSVIYKYNNLEHTTF